MLIAKELHVDFDIKLQQVNSNLKDSITPQEVDWIINSAALQYINSKVNPKSNPKGDGYDNTQKRYDDLAELKRSVTLTPYKYSSDMVYINLPRDYYTLTDNGTRSEVIYNCNGITFTEEIDNIPYATAKFKDDIAVGIKYATFKIELDDVVIFDITDYIISPIYTSKGKFEIIHIVLEELNKLTDMKVYWENWDDKYYPDQFIFEAIGTTPTKVEVITSATIETTALFALIPKTYYDNSLNSTEWSNRLISSMYFFSMMNDPFNKTIHYSPLAYMENKRIYIKHSNEFLINKVNVTYIKRPRLVSIARDQTFEVMSKANEIVNIAVQKVEAWTNDPSYRNTVIENLLVD